MDSLEMISALETKGTLTKQAAHRLQLQRQKLIREEFVKEAGKLSRVLGDAKAVLKDAVGSPSLKKVPHGAGPGDHPWGRAGVNIAKMMALGGMAAGGSAGINMAIRHGRDKKLNSEIANSYNLLRSEEPALAKHDPDAIRKNFEVLARFAPSLAANPTVASRIVNENLHRGGADANSVKLMTDIQKSIDSIHQGRSPWGDSPASRHMNLASKALGG